MDSPPRIPPAHGAKLLLYTDESTAGGVAHFNHALLQALLAAGWSVHSAQPPPPTPFLEEQQRWGVASHRLAYEPSREFTRSFTDLADPERIFSDAAPDLIFFSDCCPLSNLAAKHVAVTRGIPYVVMCHSGAAYLAEKFPAVLPVARQQYNRARQVIAISSGSLAMLHRTFGLSPSKGVVIMNGRPEKFFAPPDPAARRRIRAELGLPADAVLSFTSARFDSGKGYQHQLAALKLLHEQNRLGPLQFAWAGTGDLQAQFAEAVRGLGLAPRVRLLGQRWDIPDLLAAADLFVLPTLHEGGLPLAPMEAMAMGVPTLVTGIGNIPEIVGSACRVLPDPNLNPNGTVVQLAQAWVGLAADPAQRLALGRAGRALAEREFRQEINLGKTLAVLDAALARAPAAAVTPTVASAPPAPAGAPPGAPAPTPVIVLSAPEPLVTAIVSTYKSERFIAGCLEDLTAQTLFQQGRLEIVVVDSHSPEHEGDIVRRFQRDHPRLVYLRTPERESLYAAWNRGIRTARGRYVTNANTDDRHRPNGLELMALALEARPDVALVYGDCHLSTIPNERFTDNPRSRTYLYPDFFAPAALLHYQIGPQPMWRKAVHDTLGWFDGSLRAAGDYDFNLRLARQFPALHLPVVLGSYLAHAGAISFADDTMPRETRAVHTRYENDATIEALYARAGVTAGAGAEKFRLHLDLGRRALEYFPPWNEGRAEANAALAAKCFLRAFELEPRRAEAVNNLFCLLVRTGQPADALALLKKFPALLRDPVLRANQEHLQRGRADALTLLPSGLDLPGQRELATGLRPPLALAS